MIRKEAHARVGIRELISMEIKELKALADDIYTRVLGTYWRNFRRDKQASSAGSA
jgi:hypothetical protein